MSSNNNHLGDIGFSGLLIIAFIVLKLTNVITWPWWWVLAPMWMPIILAGLLSLIVLVIWIIKLRKR